MIVGKRVRLRALSKADLPAFVDWLNDADVRRNLTLYQPVSMEQEERWFLQTLALPVDEQPLSIEAKRGADWQLVGNIGFMNLDTHARSAEIGLFIGIKDLWDKGLGGEAMRLMLAHGFQTLNLNRIYLCVYESNLRGVRCYEKAGFQLEGRLREARFLEGRYIDILMMSILKSEWTKEQLRKEGNS